jgi:radical SAM superfamily enzyme YgiQ (UPF0313 family)
LFFNAEHTDFRGRRGIRIPHFSAIFREFRVKIPMPDITLINLNMLFMRYGEEIERERHVPLGPLYLTRALEDAGFDVDFRDYQNVESDEPFTMETFLQFVSEPAPIIGISCMANLLPFTVLALEQLRQKYPDRILILGGVGSKSVEEKLLQRFPWIDIICRGEAELTAPELLRVLTTPAPPKEHSICKVQTVVPPPSGRGLGGGRSLKDDSPHPNPPPEGEGTLSCLPQRGRGIGDVNSATSLAFRFEIPPATLFTRRIASAFNI